MHILSRLLIRYFTIKANLDVDTLKTTFPFWWPTGVTWFLRIVGASVDTLSETCTQLARLFWTIRRSITSLTAWPYVCSNSTIVVTVRDTCHNHQIILSPLHIAMQLSWWLWCVEQSCNFDALRGATHSKIKSFEFY